MDEKADADQAILLTLPGGFWDLVSAQRTEVYVRITGLSSGPMRTLHLQGWVEEAEQLSAPHGEVTVRIAPFNSSETAH